MKEFWNERYGHEAYAYGEEPNVFFKESLTKYPDSKGKLLMPAEGEGRNAVFAATLGWEVFAFDISESGKTKADRLADKYQVKIDYKVAGFDEITLKPESFDAVGMIYAHFHEKVRKDYCRQVMHALKPGGIVFMEVFSKNHLKFNAINPKAGGPKDEALLLSIENVREEFAGMAFEYLEEQEIDLHEGSFHIGKSSVIRMIGRKQ